MENYKSIIDYKTLKQIVTVANNVSYVYQNFLSNKSIIELATACSSQELIGLYYDEYNGNRTLENLVNLYSLIISLSLHDDTHAVSFFQNLCKGNVIKWAKELASIYFNRITFSSFEVPYKINKPTISDQEIDIDKSYNFYL